MSIGELDDPFSLWLTEGVEGWTSQACFLDPILRGGGNDAQEMGEIGRT
jgi:hypothetical protein